MKIEKLINGKWFIKGSQQLEDWAQNTFKNECNVCFNYEDQYFYNPSKTLKTWSWNLWEAPEGYIEITFEQFKSLINPKEPMKTIKSYKLIKPEYELAAAKLLNSSQLYGNIMAQSDINTLKKAGVLDLWFEPVYDDVFKVGELVFVVKDFEYSHPSEFDNKLYPFAGYTKNHESGYKYKVHVGVSEPRVVWEIRKATPLEIKNHQSKTVTLSSGKVVTVTKDGVKGQGESLVIPMPTLERLFKKTTINTYDVQVQTVDIGCWKGLTYDDFVTVNKLYKTL